MAEKEEWNKERSEERIRRRKSMTKEAKKGGKL